jgi:uncharacterized repeat protein (TIGR02543 family)
MKNYNLIEWLLSYSHEKQTPQRFGRYAAMLIMLLTLGVGQMWADNYYNVGVAATIASNYTMKVGVTAKDWSWYTHDMTKAGLTFEGKELYLNTINTGSNGKIGEMKFLLYDESTWKGESTVLSSWTETDASTMDNKIWNYASSAWYTSLSFSKSARFYFDASTWDETSIKLVIGHANYQKYYSLSNITNTKLYYGNTSDAWGDAMHIGVVGNTTASDGTNWPSDISDKASEYTGLKNYALSSDGAGNAYLMVPNGDKGQQPSMNYYATHYNTDALNSTQTIKYAVGVNGGTPAELTSGYVPANIAISSYKFSSKKYNAVDASSGSATLSKNGSNYSATVTAARTATTTYTVSNIDDDYAFLGWYDAASGGNLLEDDETYTFYPTSATTVYARFSHENNHSVTISRYCTSTSSEINNTTAKVGEVTYSEISAPVIAGYSFSSWSYGNGISVKAGDNTSTNPIHVKTLSSGTYTLTANYTEVLTTDWKLIGDNQTESPFGDNYTYNSGQAMSKKSGHSTESNAYKTINVTKLPADNYGFKVATASGNSNEYGWGTGDGAYITFNRSASNVQKQVYNGDQHQLKFVPDALGEYEFRVEYPGNKYVYVTFPTAYAVTYNIGSVAGTSGSISATYSSVSFSSGTKVQSGKSVTLAAPAAKAGYTWKGWYTNAAGTEGKINDVSRAITVTVNAAKTLYACYTENMTTVNLVASPTGKGTFTSGGGAVTSVSAGVATKPSVTAVPGTGYRVNTSATVWATNNANITLNNVKANPVTVTGAGSGSTSTLTATFTPKTYTITLHEQGATTSGTPGDGGTITATFDATTNLSKITAVPERTGYTFGGYYDTEECDGTWIIKTDTYFNWDGTYLDSEGGFWKYDGNVDLYAKWTANRYTVTLDVDEANKGTTTGATTSQDIYYDDATVTVPNLPTAANGYKFDGYYTDQLGEGTKVINGDGTWIASVAGYTDASKHWIHADNVTLYAYYKKASITALTLDDAIVETNATVGVTPTVSPTPEGDTKLCFYVFHGNDNPLDPQPSISWNGTKATFNAGETSGTYKIGVALRTGTECGGGTLLDSTTVSYQVAGTHSVTVRYKCGDDVIKAATTLDGIRPLDWSDEITAPDIIGYSFTGWSAGDGVTLTDDDGSSTKTSTAAASIKIKAIYDGYLTANYSKKRIIYFNNTLNWENVYVYFYKNGSYWDLEEDRGTGCNTTYGFTDTPFEESLYGQMQPVEEGSKIYYFDAEAAGVNASYQTVVFTELDQHTYNWFSKTEDVKNKVIKRDDYYSSKLPMYVPLAVQTADPKNGNTADYYWQGYWMNYPENTGYTLKIYNKKTRSDAPDAGSKDPVELKSIPFEFTADKTMPMELDVDLEAGQTYGFKIYRNDGLNTGAGSYYGNTGTMTANAEGWSMTTGASSNAGLQTTAAGSYKFVLNFYEISSDYQYRVSVTYPVASGDYRLLYKDDVHTLWHPSAVIPKANAKDTVSFFVRTGQHAYLKLQKCTALGAGTVTWTDTVTWWNNGSGVHSAVTQDSVYNICLMHNASTGKLEIENVEAYTGNYYIRTDAANSKWDNYRTDPDHVMTYSEYSITHGGYSHYYTHWVQTNDDNRKNIKFCIANDYSPCISDTLTRESNAVSGWENINNYIDAYGNILRNSNVRFMWDRHTNTISRAYVDGAQGPGSNNFLYILNTDSPNKIRWSAESALTSNKVTFADNGNWIYEANIQAQPNAQIKLLSNWGTSSTITQYFKGSSSTSEDLVGGSGDTWYDIRVIYDFKTNRLVASYIPSGDISSQIAINADVMFIREHQGDIAQLTFSKDGEGKMGAISKIETAYGVLRLNKWTLNNKEKTGTHAPLASPKSRYERDLFYISFPFRVAMEDVFGFGTYGVHWIIEEYDGAGRAANGYWQESGPNWKFVFNRKNKFFEPYQGYVIALDLDELGESSSVWANTDQVELYFPSYGTMPDITNASVNCTIPEHLCAINRSEELGGNGTPLGSAYDRRVKDSNWNVISVPTYVNTSNITFANTDWITTADDTHVGPNFLYEWNPDDNSVTARSGVGYTYAAMHAYLVQYCGVITWSSSVSPAAAPRRNPEYRGEYEFRLEMLQNGEAVDQTFVKLSDNEAVTTGFEFNYDLSKEFNSGKANIYTRIGTEQAAGNVLPLTDQTTVVPVGVKIAADGDYTFSMPDGTEGIGITLVDTETGIRTILSALDYTVNLAAGTYDNRFFLEISPIMQTPTDVEEVTGDGLQVTGARKVIIDQKMFIIKDGKMYDAQGRQVK